MTRWTDEGAYLPDRTRRADDAALDVAEWLQRDPAEMLRRSGFRRTLVDDFSDFIADIRSNPSLSATVFGLGIAFGLIATVGIAYVISWVVA